MLGPHHDIAGARGTRLGERTRKIKRPGQGAIPLEAPLRRRIEHAALRKRRAYRCRGEIGLGPHHRVLSSGDVDCGAVRRPREPHTALADLEFGRLRGDHQPQARAQDRRSCEREIRKIRDP